MLQIKNPYIDYVLVDSVNVKTDRIVMDPFYPCIKYKIPADPKLDGTDYFIIAESMYHKGIDVNWVSFRCSFSFICEYDKKAFYNLIKVCLRYSSKKLIEILRKHSLFS